MLKIGTVKDCPKCEKNSLEYVRHGLWVCVEGGKYYEADGWIDWSCGYSEEVRHECPQCGKLNLSGRNGRIVLCINYGGCGHKYKVIKND